MKNLSFRIIPIIIILTAVAVLSAAAHAGTGVEDAFWRRDWRTMDNIYSKAASQDVPGERQALSLREKSIYVNGHWIQGRYDEGVSLLESIHQDFPIHLRAYADMLLILGK